MAHIPSDRMVYGVAKDQSFFNILAGKTQDKRYTGKVLFKSRAIERDMEALAREYTVKCESAEQTVGMLSGGNIQKVVVAREMSSNPKLLVADQPTRGIDVGAGGIYPPAHRGHARRGGGRLAGDGRPQRGTRAFGQHRGHAGRGNRGLLSRHRGAERGGPRLLHAGRQPATKEEVSGVVHG